jgi:hypothetical protein
MFRDLSVEDQLLMAIEFHLTGSKIPQELQTLLGDQLVQDITSPVIESIPNEHRNQ